MENLAICTNSIIHIYKRSPYAYFYQNVITDFFIYCMTKKGVFIENDRLAWLKKMITLLKKPWGLDFLINKEIRLANRMGQPMSKFTLNQGHDF